MFIYKYKHNSIIHIILTKNIYRLLVIVKNDKFVFFIIMIQIKRNIKFIRIIIITINKLFNIYMGRFYILLENYQELLKLDNF
jgi:hypothetical protein